MENDIMYFLNIPERVQRNKIKGKDKKYLFQKSLAQEYRVNLEETKNQRSGHLSHFHSIILLSILHVKNVFNTSVPLSSNLQL